MSNAIGLVKIATLLFVIVTGFVILGGNTKIENPTANFKNSFSGTENASAYGLTNALYRIIFSYGGYNNAFNVVNEVKVAYGAQLPSILPGQYLTSSCKSRTPSSPFGSTPSWHSSQSTYSISWQMWHSSPQVSAP